MEFPSVPSIDDIPKVPPPSGVGAHPSDSKAGAADKSTDRSAVSDLITGSLGLSSANPKVGERVFATAILRNKSSRALSGVRVRFFLDQVQLGEKVVAVAAGSSATASCSFKASKSGAQNLQVQVDPGSGIAPLTLARGLAVTAAAPLPPQRLYADRPQAYAPAPDISRQPPPDKGKEGRGDKGKGGPEGGIPLGDRPPSPIPEDLEGQTKVARGPGGKVIGWGDGIYGVEGKGTGVSTAPEGLSELDKLLNYGKWPSTGTGGPDLGFYHGIDPSKGPGKWAKDEKVYIDVYSDGSTLTTNTRTPKGDVVGAIATEDKNGRLVSLRVELSSGDWAVWHRGGGGDVPEGADAKPSPKEPDPNMVLVLMKAPPGRHTDPRIGKVGDPALAGKPSREAMGAAIAAIAAGAGTAEAMWQFAGVKPGAFLKGPRDPNLPGGKGGEGGGLRPDLPIFTLPDPPEARAISAARARTGAPGAPSVTVSAAAGAVQVLATREGKRGWTPLKAGDKLAAKSVIRVGKDAGAEVGVGDLKTARSMSWNKIHSGPNHDLYQLQIKK